MSKIAFIGLGNMGGPMAANLIKAGHQLRVFDLAPAALDAASAAGAHAASSAQDTLVDIEVVISMLPASRHVEGLYLGESGILAQISDGALVIDCSTIAPLSARKVADAAKARGLTMLDAPVSGGTAGAAAGTLTFIVGGAADALERAPGAAGDGQEHLPRRRQWGRAGRQAVQQHGLGRDHGGHGRSAGAWRRARPGPCGAVADDGGQHRAQLGYRGVQPVARRAAQCAGVAWV
ncbi:putative 3-hydroxyisobutyrate dehydrogenase [Xanthomonas citri pv. punicae str. LMG 859]|nr:putative 3-hydroxyisobutyrate dehydrogenase [Xanthomonas citri pv. punicae str. LMG 859]